MKRKKVLASWLGIGWGMASTLIVVYCIDNDYLRFLILVLLSGIGFLAIGLFVYRIDFLKKLKLYKSWKKVQIKNLEKRIKRLESELALYEDEYPVDEEFGPTLSPFVFKKTQKLGELRRKYCELTNN